MKKKSIGLNLGEVFSAKPLMLKQKVFDQFSNNSNVDQGAGVDFAENRSKKGGFQAQVYLWKPGVKLGKLLRLDPETAGKCRLDVVKILIGVRCLSTIPPHNAIVEK
ncbi:hypothetical protein V6N13_091656 [Hibiscus sabdariffa]